MKRFISLLLTASLLFVGAGALVERAAASLRSDEKALALIAKARQAIGGEQLLASVRSMRIKGNVTRTTEFNGQLRIDNGESEMALMLPDKMVKSVKFAGGTDGMPGAMVREVGVVAVKQLPPGAPMPTDGVKRVIIQDKDGKMTERTGAHADILVREVPAGSSGQKVVIRVDEQSGSTASDDMPGGPDVKQIRVIRNGDVAFGTNTPQRNELFKTTLALLLTAPDGVNVSYTYAGTATVDGVACEVVNASMGSNEYRLHLAADTGLPVMLSYKGIPSPTVVAIRPVEVPRDGKQADTLIFKTSEPAVRTMTEIEVRFSDYRNVGGINLPFRWSQTEGGKVDETFTISGYEINPADIGDSFKQVNVVVRGDAKDK